MTRLEDRQTLVDLIAETRASGSRQAPACALAGIDPRTFQRWRKQDGGDRRPDAIRPAPSHALTEEERVRIVEVSNEPRFAETPPGSFQCWPTKVSISPASRVSIGCCVPMAK